MLKIVSPDIIQLGDFGSVKPDHKNASKMISELGGDRGQEPVSIEAPEDSLLKLSSFIENKPKIKELDLNPMFAYSDRVVAADARMILESRIE